MSMASENIGEGGSAVVAKGKGSVVGAPPSSSRRPDSSADKKTVVTSPPSPRLSPPPLTSSSSANTSTPPERKSGYASGENKGSSPGEDWCVGAPSGEDNPLRLRESAKRSSPGIKGQKMCAYELCPSPLHSKKWRVVTAGTNAGGRDWNALVGETLCDSCYSTFRKHGTFVRSIRTNEGWSRVGAGAGAGGAACKGGLGEKRDKWERPKKALQAQQQLAPHHRVQRTPKRSRMQDDRDDGSSVAKRQDRKAAIKSGWWRRGGGVDDVERELLEAVAILRSLHSSQPFDPEPCLPAASDLQPPPRDTDMMTPAAAAAADSAGPPATGISTDSNAQAAQRAPCHEADGTRGDASRQAHALAAVSMPVCESRPGLAQGHGDEAQGDQGLGLAHPHVGRAGPPTLEVDLGALDTVRRSREVMPGDAHISGGDASSSLLKGQACPALAQAYSAMQDASQTEVLSA